jgi:hypothetical protein
MIRLLVGRWRSDEMLRYLQVQAEPTMRGFSARMLQHGGLFVLLPNNHVPCLLPSEFPSMSHVSCPMLLATLLPSPNPRWSPSSVEVLEALPPA